jgi:membrane fusion protein (multidrug efflux system)
MDESRNSRTTDNAYVTGNVVQITPQIPGAVLSIAGQDTQFVVQGQVLVQLDSSDARVALDEAESQLAKTVREVRYLFATTDAMHSTVRLRQAELESAEQDLERRERMASSGAISLEELQHARDKVHTAEATLSAVQQQLVASEARTDRTTVAGHPEVRAASAAVRDAYFRIARTQIAAPVSGFISKRNVQLGQLVDAGVPMMAVIPLDEVWVEANFKESELSAIHPGQPATLTSDLYGKSVIYHGHVIGFGAGTGAAFSLLPAQNATGNWIKIVQRIPVRISIDPQTLAVHPLQLGLSMRVNVDVRDRHGVDVSVQKVYLTERALDEPLRSADALAKGRIQAIISDNVGQAAHLEPINARNHDHTY